MTNNTLRRALGFGAAVFFLALYYWKFTAPPPSQASNAEGRADVSIEKEPPPSPNPQASLKAQPLDEPAIREVLAIETEAQFQKAFQEADFMRSSELTQLVERMKISQAKSMADYLLKSLHEAGDQNPDQRDRIMLLAEAWRSDELLPLWQDLALRTTPRYRNESALINQPEPTELSRGVQLEMMTAVSNLGSIGPRSPEALQTLKEIVAASASKVHSIFIRERAYQALKEADLTASILALKKLEDEDPLRSQIQRN